MQTISFGSCLSNLTAKSLVSIFNYTQINNIAHNRSDCFVKYYVKKEEMIPHSYLENLEYAEGKEEEANNFILNQYPSMLGKHEQEESKDLFDNLKNTNIDIFILDNYLDVAAKVMLPTCLEKLKSSPIFINSSYFTNSLDYFRFGDFLKPEESVANWKIIINMLLEYQPNAFIFFLCFPYSTSNDKLERKFRSQRFAELFQEIPRKQNCIVVPPFNVLPHLTKPNDWAHFDNRIYASLAGFIHYHKIELEKLFTIYK